MTVETRLLYSIFGGIIEIIHGSSLWLGEKGGGGAFENHIIIIHLNLCVCVRAVHTEPCSF